MDMPIHRLIYSSRINLPADRALRAAEFDRILASARKYNWRDGITGALLVNDICFVQVLEGPADAVRRTFARIQEDARHGHSVVLESRGVRDRGFDGHPMAFVDARDNYAAMMVAEFGIFPALRRIVSEQRRIAA